MTETAAFLSDAWMSQVAAITSRHEGSAIDTAGLVVNATITDVPFDDGTVELHSEHGPVIGWMPGHATDAALSFTLGYALARELVLDVLNAPIGGALLTGPPFVNPLWRQLTDDRDPGSPESLPLYQDGRTVRFTAQEDALNEPTGRWGDTKVVYLQHASDPVTFFSPNLALRSPDWLKPGQRGPDVSPEMGWVPLVTMWQVLFDLPVAGDVPAGYGHLYTSAEYLSGWVGISRPDGWTDADNDVLIEVLAERERTIEE